MIIPLHSPAYHSALEEDAKEAVSIMNGQNFKGRRLTVDMALKRGRVGREALEQHKQQQRKQVAPRPDPVAKFGPYATTTVVCWGVPEGVRKPLLEKRAAHHGEVDHIDMHVALPAVPDATEKVCLVVFKKLDDARMVCVDNPSRITCVGRTLLSKLCLLSILIRWIDVRSA